MKINMLIECLDDADNKFSETVAHILEIKKHGKKSTYLVSSSSPDMPGMNMRFQIDNWTRSRGFYRLALRALAVLMNRIESP